MRLRYAVFFLCIGIALVGAGCDRAADAGGALASAPALTDLTPHGPPEPAPLFTLPGVDGPFSLEEQHGRVVVLTFWASWSEPSVAGLDTLATLAAELDADDLVAVGVAQDEHGLAALRAWADESVTGALPVLTLVSDSAHTVAASYGDVEMLPTTVVIDREGRIRARHVGALTTEELLDLATPALIEAEEAPVADLSLTDALPVVEALPASAVPGLVADGAALLDVRPTESRAAEGAVRYAAHLPPDALSPSDLPANLDVPLVFLADTEADARAAAEQAIAWGYATVYAVGGGVRVWEAAGLTVEAAPPARRPRGVVG
ncbi:MAG TPA: TlpA disulfide reductase family protein [Rhodothermales bacterium]|nr:TlpA disulfide reductase family protein [Rhodothermales bacterium]